jgi:hypothetical protein
MSCGSAIEPPDKIRRLVLDNDKLFILAIALLVLLLIELISFATIQDIWTDETTQLSGITLDIEDLLRWLTGVDALRFGVPGDRMPPLSYLLDWGWLRLFGSSEIGFRLFHSAFVFCGVAGLAILAWRQIGQIATTIFLGFMALSPKLIQAGVEIRAYPIFFAIACAQTAVFLRLAGNPADCKGWPLATFALLCLAAIYTHFFGIVSSGAFAVALAVSLAGHRDARKALVLSFAVVAIGTLGVLPFVLAAGKIPPTVVDEINGFPAPHQMTAERLLAYFFRLFADAPNMVWIGAAASFFAGTLALLAASAAGPYFRPQKRYFESGDWLFVVVLVGILVTMTAGFLIKSFDPLKPAYSIWMLPLIGFITASGWRSLCGYLWWEGAGRTVATSAMLIGAALSAFVFFADSQAFMHGPGRFMTSLYDKETAPKAIIYPADAEWGFAYYPLIFRRGDQTDQYAAARDEISLNRIKKDRHGPLTLLETVTTAAQYKVIFIVDLKLRSYADIRRCENNINTCPQFEPRNLKKILIESGQWKARATERQFGIYDTQVDILEKTGEPITKLPGA